MKQSINLTGLIIGLMLTLTLGFSVNGQIKSVKIGTQTWSTENLGVTKFRDGSTIRQAQKDEDWRAASRAGKPAWCYYQNDESNGPKYGKLYNWFAINDKRGIAPKGWHVPTDDEWRELGEAAGGPRDAGSSLKDSVLWNEEGNGDNSTGFAGRPGGSRYSDGTFKLGGDNGYWWTKKEFSTTSAWAFYLSRSNYRLGDYKSEKRNGFAVRLVKD